MTGDAKTAAYTVADYLLDRLAELGVEHAFGVPGDYTLSLLDHITAHPRVEWVGCTNELNAGYAADAYGRLRGAAALFTTFGVGELSAINAVAGSYAEFVPVVEVVGSPASASQAAHRIVHHSLGDGVFDHFIDMHAPITCARAALTPDTAATEIDRVLCAARDHRLPGYLLLPADVADAPAGRPADPLPPSVTVTDPAALAAFTDAARRLVASVPDTGAVTFLTGLLVHRLGAVEHYRRLVGSAGVRYATTMWAKSTVDETTPGYLGVYAGAASEPSVRTAVEDAGVLVAAGVQFTDLNSGFFTQTIDRDRTIELGAASASVGAERFDGVCLPDALTALDALLADRPRVPDAAPATGPEPGEVDVIGDLGDLGDLGRPGAGDRDGSEPAGRDVALTQDALWQVVADQLRPEDIVVAEQGTAFYGFASRRLPQAATFMGQPLWASIGYTLPAVLGASLAAPGRRVLLLIGDGAALMTVQEIATMGRLGLAPVLLVVDNDGYTIERAIHGPDQPYNDIPRVDWTALASALAPEASPRVARVTTVGELAHTLQETRLGAPRLTLVQAVVPRLDVPALLTTIAQAAAQANRRVPT